MQTNFPKYIIIHCTDVSYNDLYDQFNSVNQYHRDVRGFNRSTLGYYVGYHRLITGGKMYVARQDPEYGNHCNQVINGQSMNFKSLGICVGFDGDREKMHPADEKMLRDQIKLWMYQYGIKEEDVRFHRDFNIEKTCPGSLMNKAWLNDLLTDSVVVDLKLNQKKIEIMKQSIPLYEKIIELLLKLIKQKYGK